MFQHAPESPAGLVKAQMTDFIQVGKAQEGVLLTSFQAKVEHGGTYL